MRISTAWEKSPNRTNYHWFSGLTYRLSSCYISLYAHLSSNYGRSLLLIFFPRSAHNAAENLLTNYGPFSLNKEEHNPYVIIHSLNKTFSTMGDVIFRRHYRSRQSSIAICNEDTELLAAFSLLEWPEKVDWDNFKYNMRCKELKMLLMFRNIPVFSERGKIWDDTLNFMSHVSPGKGPSHLVVHFSSSWIPFQYLIIKKNQKSFTQLLHN